MKTEILQFILAKGAGDIAIQELLLFNQANGEEETRLLFESSQLLQQKLYLREEVANNILDAQDQTHELENALEENQVDLIWIGHSDYPQQLKNILEKEAPAFLFVKGNTDLLNSKSIGFCGSRNTSEEGFNITAQLTEQLVQEQYCITSGYAQGVDIAAHQAALENDGTTIIVLAEGILKTSIKQQLNEQLTSENYLYISQFPPMLSWQSHNAMKRNSTIIGLTEAMILVESGMTGGTYAAGEETLKRNQPLYVVDNPKQTESTQAIEQFKSKGAIPIPIENGNTPDINTLFKNSKKNSSQQKQSQQTDIFNFAG